MTGAKGLSGKSICFLKSREAFDLEEGRLLSHPLQESCQAFFDMVSPFLFCLKSRSVNSRIALPAFGHLCLVQPTGTTLKTPKASKLFHAIPLLTPWGMCFFHLSEGAVGLFKKKTARLLCPSWAPFSPLLGAAVILQNRSLNFCSPYGASGCFLGPDQRALFIAVMFHQDDIYVGIKILTTIQEKGARGNGLLTLAGLPPRLMKSCTPKMPGTGLCYGKAIKQKYPIGQPIVSRNASLLCTM